MRRTIVMSSRHAALIMTVTRPKAIILRHAAHNRAHDEACYAACVSFFLFRSPLFFCFVSFFLSCSLVCFDSFVRFFVSFGFVFFVSFVVFLRRFFFFVATSCIGCFAQGRQIHVCGKNQHSHAKINSFTEKFTKNDVEWWSQNFREKSVCRDLL